MKTLLKLLSVFAIVFLAACGNNNNAKPDDQLEKKMVKRLLSTGM